LFIGGGISAAAVVQCLWANSLHGISVAGFGDTVPLYKAVGLQ